MLAGMAFIAGGIFLLTVALAERAHASQVPPSFLISDSFDDYSPGANLDTASSSRWTANATTGHWVVSGSGCQSGNCITGVYNTTGAQPDAFLWTGDPDNGAQNGSITMGIKWNQAFNALYSTNEDVGFYNGSTITSTYGFNIQAGSNAGTVKMGGPLFYFDNLNPTVYHQVSFYWVSDINVGVSLSLSVDNSIPQVIATSTDTTSDFVVKGVNEVELTDYLQGATTYIDNLNAQLIDNTVVSTDYGALATSTCSITNITGCFQNALQWAFVPPQGSFSGITGLWAQIDQKPPFGYFTVGLNEVNGLNNGSTPAFSLESIDGINTYIFHPIDVALAAIWWGIFGIWFFFNRVRHIEI